MKNPFWAKSRVNWLMKDLILALLIHSPLLLKSQVLEVKTDSSVTVLLHAFVFQPDTIVEELTTKICTNSIGYLDDQKRIGTWTFNHCNQNYFSEKIEFQTPNVIANYSNGLLHGKYISYYADSTIKSEFHFENGTLTGDFACYNEHGIKIFSGTVDPKSDTALGKEFNSTGSFKRDRSFKLDFLVKDWLNEI